MARKSCFELLRDISNYIFVSRDTPPGDKLHVSRFQATCICIVDILLGSEISHYWWLILVTHLNFKVLTCIELEGFEFLKISKIWICWNFQNWSSFNELKWTKSIDGYSRQIQVRIRKLKKNSQIIKNFDHSIKTWRFFKFINLGISNMKPFCTLLKPLFNQKLMLFGEIQAQIRNFPTKMAYFALLKSHVRLFWAKFGQFSIEFRWFPTSFGLFVTIIG